MNTTGKLLTTPFNSSAVIELDQNYFPHPWNEIQWQELNSQHHRLLTWNLDSVLVGFALLSIVPGDDVAHLYKIVLRPEHRGLGHAQNFWNAICENLKQNAYSKVFLEVEASNERAIRFYVKSGFSILRKIQGYYSNGEDAIVMILTL
jgi:[ribosomal protein S18]-alanine N-acetyltransferase